MIILYVPLESSGNGQGLRDFLPNPDKAPIKEAREYGSLSDILQMCSHVKPTQPNTSSQKKNSKS